ncbi:MAG: hypothetical protein EA363_05275 [Balneolaceae bacterium]|nr:MAG: hypothetical protein EA363_05275 [Balneolaceae bacterium]
MNAPYHPYKHDQLKTVFRSERQVTGKRQGPASKQDLVVGFMLVSRAVIAVGAASTTRAL